jgi:anti-sigma factor RsiW
MDTPISLPSEKFELLSAYLDGEVSPTERQQVEAWLASDAKLQETYRQMLALQNGLKTIPAAAPSMPTEQLVSQVMLRLDRQQSKRWVWGGLGAAAALLIGALSGLLSGNQGGGMFQTAQQPLPSPSIALPQQPDTSSAMAMRPGNAAESKTLMIVLERPPVAIPDVPASSQPNTFDDSAPANF